MIKNIMQVSFLALSIASCGGGGSGDGGTKPQPQPQNQPPSANAGADQSVDENSQVTLTGSGTDSDGTIASYTWLQTSGTSVTLQNADSKTGSFQAPEVTADEQLVFELTVTDDEGASATDSVQITITAKIDNQPPSADAGTDQSVDKNSLVTLTGSGTDSDGTIASYRWLQISGTSVTLQNADSKTASFQAPEAAAGEQLIFELTVTDDEGVSATDSVKITIIATQPPAGADWTNVKIGGHGYTPGVIFHPVVQDVYYIRTDIGGIYRWDEEAMAWHPVTDNFGPTEGNYIGAESVALDPNDDGMLYMSTGLYVQGGGNGRLYISTDHGDNWTHAELPFPVGANNNGRSIGERMMVDPNQPSTLFYGSRTEGLWKSTDSGQNWTQVTSLSSATMSVNWGGAVPAGIEFVLFDTDTMGIGSATQTIYIGVGPEYAEEASLDKMIYKSTDGGATWSGVSTPLDGDSTDYYIPHAVRSDDGDLYFIFTGQKGPGAGGPARLYRYDGSNWELLRQRDPASGVNAGYSGLSVYGSGSSTKIALGISGTWGTWADKPVVELSEDAGLTWREISNGKPHTPNEDVSGWIDDVEINPFNPDHIMHVTGGGPWETYNATDAEPTWNKMVENLEETATLNLTTPPPTASWTLLNASGDIGTWVHTTLEEEPERTPSGDLKFANGVSADMAWSDPSYIATIGTRHWGFGGGSAARYSRDNGLTWTAFGSLPTLPDGGLSNSNNIVVTSPDNLIWSVVNDKPYYSTDSGSSWTASNLPKASGTYILAADRQNPSKVYAYDHGGNWWGNAGKFFYSTDGGKTFTQSTDANLDLSANSWDNTSIAVNPNAEGDVWLVDGHSIFHSLDSGVTWTKLDVTTSVYGSNDWPDINGASSIALGKAAEGSSYSAAVYVVGVINNQWGVYRSDDMGVNWIRINDDEHQYGGISRLVADNKIYGRVYFAGTGRGIIYNK